VSRKNRYSVWVGFGGTEVREFPIEGAEGRFDIEVPLPEEPGVYRVAMSVQKKRRMPDNPFFFSLYVGVDPPTSFTSPLEIQDDVPGPLADWEDEVVARINQARASHGLGELELIQRDVLREIVAGAPEKELARFRYYTRKLAEDPLPERPHGLWHPSFGGGVLPADAAWIALEHPISRASLLDADLALLAYGAAQVGGERHILLVPMEPTPDAASASEVVRAELSGRVAGGLKKAPLLEAELDNIAAKIASGRMPFNRYFAPIKQLVKKTSLLGGAINANALGLPPGGPANLADFELPSGARYLAIGDAVGDLGRGDGIQYTVLVIVVSTKAK
jgi:hypothetical protein